MSKGAFAGLSSLESLDLGGNYVRGLAREALCSRAAGPVVPGLRSLNLANNEIATLEAVGDLSCLRGSLVRRKSF